jgi:hypothetical protein
MSRILVAMGIVGLPVAVALLTGEPWPAVAEAQTSPSAGPWSSKPAAQATRKSASPAACADYFYKPLERCSGCPTLKHPRNNCL